MERLIFANLQWTCFFKNFRIKENSHPWISNDIILLMKEHDKLHRQATLNSDPVLFSHHKELRNKITFEITQKKKNYVTNIIGKPKNSKDLWNALNTVSGKKITSDSTQSELNCSDRVPTQIQKQNSMTFP